MLLVTVPGGSAPLPAPDGAFYVVPKGVNGAYLSRALDHLASISTHAGRLAEFGKMYTEKTHPYYLDFKRFGTPSGPPGYRSITPIEYYSQTAGKIIRASPFEPAGNFFYGFIGTLAGISPDELIAAAWMFQEGRNGMFDKYVRNFLKDTEEDVPHVNCRV